MRKTFYAIDLNLLEIEADVNDHNFNVTGHTPSRKHLLSHYNGSFTKEQAEAIYAACDEILKRATPRPAPPREG